MIYVQQVRSRKRPLVPINMDNEIKIEFVNVADMDEFQMSSSNDYISSSDDMEQDQIVEVVTAESIEENEDSSGTKNSPTGQRPRKRTKLDHLTPEQKAQHRKMMNRISAQSARDRQRVLMGQQEQTIIKLTQLNSELEQENVNLKTTNEQLMNVSAELKKSSSAEISHLREENLKLKNLVEELQRKLKANEFQLKSEPVLEEDAGSCGSSSEPAVLDTNPLLKGQKLQQTSAFLILMSALSLWMSSNPKFSKISNTSQSKFFDMIQHSQDWKSLSLVKQLLHLQSNLTTATQMRQKQPD